MNQTRAFRLDQVGVVDVKGTDREAIVHNLTTNEIKSLSTDQGCETFVTDVRGKTLAHVMLYRLDDRIRMIGPHGVSPNITGHVDRYTIREDAAAEICDDRFVGIVLTADAARLTFANVEPSTAPIRQAISLDGQSADAYTLPWAGEHSVLLLVKSNQADPFSEAFENHGISVGDESAFHQHRIASCFPWYGADLDETNLPQEADRDEATISFTKGCYLGQETVARLDALGQVQKKLVSWKIEDGADRIKTGGVQVGAKLDAAGKTVGRLTSVATLDDGTIIAIGFARRSHFDVGSVAKGTDEVNGDVYTAVVIDCG